MFSVNVVEHLNYRVAQLLFHPPALHQSVLDTLDFSIPVARVIVPGIDDNQIRGSAFKQVAGQVRDLSFRDSHNNQVPSA
jgi:hypothetical protein